MEKSEIKDIKFFEVKLDYKYQLTSIVTFTAVTMYEFKKIAKNGRTKRICIVMSDDVYEYHMVFSQRYGVCKGETKRTYQKPSSDVIKLMNDLLGKSIKVRTYIKIHTGDFTYMTGE